MINYIHLSDFQSNEAVVEGSDILITYEETGNQMGSPREAATRMLRYFVDEGAVKLSRGTVESIDKNKLLGMAER